MNFNMRSKEFRYLIYFMLLYFGFFVGMDLIRLWGFGYHVVDFGNFHQQIWNASNGDWFDTSIIAPYTADISRLSLHFSVLVTLISVPIYYIFPYAETLVFIHVFACTIAAIPVFMAASAIGASPRESAFWAVIFLITPMSLYHAIFSLQDTSFAVPIIAFAMWAVFARRFGWLLISCFLLVLAKEHYGIAVFGFGLLWAFYTGERQKGLLLAGLGLLAFYLVVFIIMPAMGDLDSHMMLSDELVHQDFQRYQWMKLPPNEFAQALPQVLFNEYNYSFLLTIFLPFLFLPLIAFPFIFPVAGDIALSLLSTFLLQKMINFYYTAALAAVFSIVSCYACVVIAEKSIRVKQILISLIFAINIYSAYVALEEPLTKYHALIGNENMDWSFGSDFAEMKKHIPQGASLLAFGGEGALLADRRLITGPSPTALRAMDVVVIRLNPHQTDYVHRNPLNVSEDLKLKDYIKSFDKEFIGKLRSVNDLLRNKKWGVTYWKFPWIIFEKDKPNTVDVKKIRAEIPLRVKAIKDAAR